MGSTKDESSLHILSSQNTIEIVRLSASYSSVNTVRNVRASTIASNETD